MQRILISDKIAEEGIEYLRSQDGFEVDFAPGLDEKTLEERIAGADALIVRSGTQVTAGLIAAGQQLRVIGRAGIGVDNIDIPAATERGIVVMNTPDANATTTAELAIAHLFSLSRNLPQADASVRAGRWERSRYVGSEVTGKTLGIIGFGTIGRIVADRALGLKMRVLGHDPFVVGKVFEGLGVEPVELERMLGEVDYLTLHCPVNDATRGLIGKQQLALMKPGARLINCARGGLVDEGALARALSEGRLAGAALDVYAQEPPLDSPLLALETMTFTPHLGASTREAQVAVGANIAEKIAAYLETGDTAGAINVTSVPVEELARLKPYQQLAHRLGLVLGAVSEGAIEQLEVVLHGTAAAVETHPVTVAALVGLLSQQMDVPVNEVNAPHLAQRREIKIVESRSEDCELFTGLVQVIARTAGGRRSVAGTLLGEREPRLVQLDEFEIEAVPEGTLLLTRHEDCPGVVGAIGTLLGREGVNISSMHVGTSDNSDEALAVLGVSGPLTAELLEEVGRIEPIRRAIQVTL